MKINWKNILIFWIALGVLTAGLFHIFAVEEYVKIDFDGAYIRDIRKNYVGRNISILITIVGAILIWGLQIYKKDSKKNYY